MELLFGKVAKAGHIAVDVDVIIEGGGTSRVRNAFVLHTTSITSNRLQAEIAVGEQVVCLQSGEVTIVLGTIGGNGDKRVGDDSNTYLTNGKGTVCLGNPTGTLSGVVRADNLVSKLNEFITLFNSHTHVEGAPTQPPASSFSASAIQSASTKVGD